MQVEKTLNPQAAAKTNISDAQFENWPLEESEHLSDVSGFKEQGKTVELLERRMIVPGSQQTSYTYAKEKDGIKYWKYLEMKEM